MARNYALEYARRIVRREPGQTARQAAGGTTPLQALANPERHQRYLANRVDVLRELRHSDAAIAANRLGMERTRAEGKVPIDWLQDAPHRGEHFGSQIFQTPADAQDMAGKAPGYTHLIHTKYGYRVIFEPESLINKRINQQLRRFRRNRSA